LPVYCDDGYPAMMNILDSLANLRILGTTRTSLEAEKSPNIVHTDTFERYQIILEGDKGNKI
jgi:hypothetical protein